VRAIVVSLMHVHTHIRSHVFLLRCVALSTHVDGLFDAVAEAVRAVEPQSRVVGAAHM